MPFAEPANNPWKDFKPLHCERPESSSWTLGLLLLAYGVLQILGGFSLVFRSITGPPGDSATIATSDALMGNLFALVGVGSILTLFLWASWLLREHRR